MISTVHMIVGGATGSAVSVVTLNPAAILVAGIVSHFVCDLIPHFDHPPVPRNKSGEIIWTPTLWFFAILESLFAFGLTFWFWYTSENYSVLNPFLIGAIGGYLPDLIDNVPFWNKYFRSTKLGNRFHRFHDWLHRWEHKYPMPKNWILGTVTQVICVSLALWYLL